MEFCRILKELRKKRGLTQDKLASLLGVAASTVSMYERGEREPSLAMLEAMSSLFGVSVGVLIGMEEAPQRAKKIRVPVYGEVAAGIPIEAIEDIEDYEELNADEFHGDFMALRIRGNSMEPKMTDGDVVIVRLQPDADTGDTAIVTVGNDFATCKKIKKTPEGLLLISTNPEYDPMFYSKKEVIDLPVRILGKVVELRAKF